MAEIVKPWANRREPQAVSGKLSKYVSCGFVPEGQNCSIMSCPVYIHLYILAGWEHKHKPKLYIFINIYMYVLI